ncbi:TetR/AcrR family transcriptional regulator [Bdellovibrionota bacterium FG-1]
MKRQATLKALKPSKPKKTKGVLTQERVLGLALQLFAKHGFDATSFQMIADRCGLSQAAVLHHFKNKDLLFERLIEMIALHNHELVSASFQIEDSAFERLRKHMTMNLKWAVSFPSEASMIVMLYYRATHNEKFSKIYSDVLVRARNRVREYLLAGIRESQFRRDLDLELAAGLIHDALLAGVLNLIATEVTPKTIAQVEQKWTLLLDSLLYVSAFA